VWQLAFGSGFKFNSCVLVANRRIQEAHTAWKDFDPQVRVRSMDSGGARARLAFAWPRHVPARSLACNRNLLAGVA
jgi:hypothetical protein